MQENRPPQYNNRLFHIKWRPMLWSRASAAAAAQFNNGYARSSGRLESKWQTANTSQSAVVSVYKREDREDRKWRRRPTKNTVDLLAWQVSKDGAAIAIKRMSKLSDSVSRSNSTLHFRFYAGTVSTFCDNCFLWHLSMYDACNSDCFIVYNALRLDASATKIRNLFLVCWLSPERLTVCVLSEIKVSRPTLDLIRTHVSAIPAKWLHVTPLCTYRGDTYVIFMTVVTFRL